MSSKSSPLDKRVQNAINNISLRRCEHLFSTRGSATFENIRVIESRIFFCCKIVSFPNIYFDAFALALNAQDFVADDLSEKIPLQTYVNYSVRNSATSLETVISDNN
jgi:hypothetical protein